MDKEIQITKYGLPLTFKVVPLYEDFLIGYLCYREFEMRAEPRFYAKWGYVYYLSPYYEGTLYDIASLSYLVESDGDKCFILRDDSAKEMYEFWLQKTKAEYMKFEEIMRNLVEKDQVIKLEPVNPDWLVPGENYGYYLPLDTIMPRYHATHLMVYNDLTCSHIHSFHEKQYLTIEEPYMVFDDWIVDHLGTSFHFSELKQLVGDEWEQQAREAEQTWLEIGKNWHQPPTSKVAQELSRFIAKDPEIDFRQHKTIRILVEYTTKYNFQFHKEFSQDDKDPYIIGKIQAVLEQDLER